MRKILIALFFILSLSCFGQTTFTGTGNWSDITKWSSGIPHNGRDAIINGTCTLNTNATCKSLTINNTAILNLVSYDLTVKNQTIINGTLTDNNSLGTVIFEDLVTNQGNWNITAPQNFTFKKGLINNNVLTSAGLGTYTFSSNNQTINANSTIRLHNVSLPDNKTINLTGQLEITGTLTIASGTFNTNNNLTLIATASSEARLASLGAGASINGNVTVQKYLSNGSRRWIHIACPLQSANYTQLTDNFYVTGGLGSTGFDVNTTGKTSAYIYDESVAGDSYNNGWYYPNNVSTSIVNTGLKIFFRGDRTPARLTNGSMPANAVVLDFTGTLKTGTNSYSVSYTNSGNIIHDGWCFIANPYASPIDWNAATGWTKTNISNTIYVWDAQNKIYSTWNGSSGTNGGSRYIGMCQGFWIKTTASSPVLISTESVKSSGNVGFFKANTEPLKMSLVISNGNNKDEVLIAKDVLERSIKLRNEVVNLNILKDSIDYAITEDADTTKLTVSGPAGVYNCIINNTIDEQFILVDCITNKYYTVIDTLNIVFMHTDTLEAVVRFLAIKRKYKTGIDVIENENKIYPNPNNGVFYIKTNEKVELYNITGKLIKDAIPVNGIASFYNIPKGLYLLITNTGYSRVYVY